MADFTPDEAAPAGRKHSRKPDLTMNIRIYVKTGHAGAWHMMSSGVYAGHGQSKTAFCLSPQTNGILKVAREKDMEPEVFCAVSRHMRCLCTPILYDGWARQSNDWHSWYHCWITERTIPLDEFIQCPVANRSQCTLAAFICVLECSSINFQFSDTIFSNSACASFLTSLQSIS